MREVKQQYIGIHDNGVDDNSDRTDPKYENMQSLDTEGMITNKNYDTPLKPVEWE